MHVSEGAYARLGKARTARLPARSNPASRCHETCGHHSTGQQGWFPHHVLSLSFHTQSKKVSGPDLIKAGRAVGALNRRHRYEARTSSACSGRRQ